MSDLPIITAVVCTRDRAHFLEKCIKSLFKQSLNRDKYEILVIDNGSTDSTADVLKRYDEEPILRSFYEPVVGLSRARNTGWKNARGLYIGYVDDDAVAGEKWLESALWCFENLSPTPDGLAGAIHLDWETFEPDWISEELKLPLGKVDWGEQPFQLSLQHSIVGANCFFSKQCLSSLGGFDERLGRIRGSLLSGEEIQLQRRIESTDGIIYYHPDVSIWHFVPKERTRPIWFYRRYYWGGISDYIMEKGLINQNRQDNGKEKEGIKSDQRINQLSRLAKNAYHSIGLFSSKNDAIHGRIYMSYVFGWFAGLFRWHLQKLFNLFHAGK